MLFAIVKPFADSGPAHALSLALGLIEDVRKFSNEFNHFVPVGLFGGTRAKDGMAITTLLELNGSQ
jgi:hypothetical protein